MAQPTYTLEELSRKVDAISEFLNEKTDRNLLNLNTVGQAIIDGKVEVEALLAQNGYAKFTWKEDNKVAKLLFNWYGEVTQNRTITFATAFSNDQYAKIGVGFAIERSGEQGLISVTNTSITTSSHTNTARTYGALFIGT